MDQCLRASRTALAVAAALGGAGASAPSATATLVKAVPIAIETEHSGGSSSFTLIYGGGPFARVSDRGRAVRIAVRQTGERRGEGNRLRYLTGSELLRGTRGTLTLRWSGTQHWSGRQWGRLSGSWSVVAGTGAYADRSGRGWFVRDKAATRFVGSLITAM